MGCSKEPRGRALHRPERKDLTMTHDEQSQGDGGHCLYSIVWWKPHQVRNVDRAMAVTCLSKPVPGSPGMTGPALW